MDVGDWVTLAVVSAAVARLILAVAECFFNVWGVD